jgi:hypothetical protein
VATLQTLNITGGGTDIDIITVKRQVRVAIVHGGESENFQKLTEVPRPMV